MISGVMTIGYFVGVCVAFSGFAVRLKSLVSLTFSIKKKIERVKHGAARMMQYHPMKVGSIRLIKMELNPIEMTMPAP